MKKVSFMLIVLLMAVVVFAAGPKRQFEPLPLAKAKASVEMGERFNAYKVARNAAQRGVAAARAPKKVVSASDLAGTYLWEYATSNETAVDLTTIEGTAASAYVTISAGEEDGTVTISGMFSNDLTGTVDSEKGVIVVEAGQLAGTSQYGDYALYGLFYYESDNADEAGWFYSDVYLVINEDGTLTVQDWLVRVLSGGTYDGYSLTPYWMPESTLTPSEGPTTVVVPNTLVVDEYTVSARNYKDDADVAGVWYVGFDGNDVYVKGMCSYLPEAWVKGTLNGTTITFASGQYFGNYGGVYDMYLNTLMNADVVFDYDAENGTLTARNDVFLTDNSQYYFDSYRGAVAKKVVETAVMPANPAINSLVNTDYGYVITFSVPNVDADGNGLISSKLTYVIYTDVEHDVQPLTFTPTTHTRLTESMTEIPFGFTEDYDFYSTQIYLNELYSADWNKIGIKSIYRGGGEVNETEIQWYTVKPYAADVAREALAEAIAAAKELLNDQSLTSGKGDLLEAIQAAEAVYGNADATVEDINAAVETLQQAMEACKAASGSAQALWVASEQGYDNAGKIESFTIDENISATVAKGESTSSPAYYNTGSALRLYWGNTLTIKAGEDVEAITKIVITTPTSNNGSELKANVGEYTFSGTTGTWTGEATEVAFTQPGTSGHARIQAISVEYRTAVSGEEPGGSLNYDLVSITPAEGKVEELYNFTISFGGQKVTVNEDALPNLTITGTDEVVAEAGIELNEDGTVSVGLDDKVTANGLYTLNIPENAILFNGKFIDPLSFKYQVGELPDYTITPAEGKVESLSTFTINFNNFMVDLNEEEAGAYLFNTETEEEVEGQVYVIGGNQAYISLAEEVTTPGSYELIIMDATFKKTIDDTFLPELAFSYTIAAAEEPVELAAYTYGFSQALNGWTTIDADGDGHDWTLVISETNKGFGGVPGMMTSESYSNDVGPLTPDNYLVSPKMKLDGKITFYAFAQDASYHKEHFGVAVSTAGNTDAADFTMVSDEWEMAAARRVAPANGPRRVQGNAYLYEVDLSQFAGQEGYVAIRHFNSTDLFRLNVDDITLYTSELLADYDPDLEVAPEQPEQPELVVLPEGAEVADYSMTYQDKDGNAASKPVFVAVVDDKVYFQGMSQYLTEAWVVGTLVDGTVIFDANQFMGEFGNYGQSYFFYDKDNIASVNAFVYDAAADTYTATGEVFGILGGQYYDGRYFNPVLSKVVEVAATPATPTITGIEASDYGDVLDFVVPTVDVDGNGLVTSKLSYQFFIDNEDTPMVLTPEFYEKLTENMTVIPYSFTDDYDISNGFIYLNMPHDTWEKIGIQSIYTGGDVENKSEIFWFDMPAGPVEAPADLEVEAYTFTAKATGNDGSETDPYSLIVQVGFDGDDVYIQGLSQDMPELWVKATKNGEGQYVVPVNQFMGELNFWGYIIPYYWTGVDAEGKMTDAVFDFNAVTSTFTGVNQMALNASATELNYNLLFDNVVITKFDEVAATPAAPVLEAFNLIDKVGLSTIHASVPATDVDGNDLNTAKLFYIVWIEKNGQEQKYTFSAELYTQDFEEDVTEVPYNHDGYDVYKGGSVIYLEDELEELESWTQVGIQSVYYGANERRESNIVWCTITTGISNVNTDTQSAVIYDLQGRRVAHPAKGLYIVNGKKAVLK